MGIAELTAKIESLSEEDYNMVIMLVNRLSEKSEKSGLQTNDKIIKINKADFFMLVVDMDLISKTFTS